MAQFRRPMETPWGPMGAMGTHEDPMGTNGKAMVTQGDPMGTMGGEKSFFTTRVSTQIQ